MIVQGWATFFQICCASCSAAFWSRYSLRNFTEFLLQSAHLRQVLEDALRLVLVDHADGKADVDQNIFSNFGFGGICQVDIFPDATEVDAAAAEGDIAVVHDLNHPAWNCETHFEPPHATALSSASIS